MVDNAYLTLTPNDDNEQPGCVASVGISLRQTGVGLGNRMHERGWLHGRIANGGSVFFLLFKEKFHRRCHKEPGG